MLAVEHAGGEHDFPAADGFHVGQVKFADLWVLRGQRMENAVEGFDLPLAIAASGHRLIAQTVESVGQGFDQAFVILAGRQRQLRARDRAAQLDRKSTRLNSSHSTLSRMPSSA